MCTHSGATRTVKSAQFPQILLQKCLCHLSSRCAAATGILRVLIPPKAFAVKSTGAQGARTGLGKAFCAWNTQPWALPCHASCCGFIWAELCAPGSFPALALSLPSNLNNIDPVPMIQAREEQQAGLQRPAVFSRQGGSPGIIHGYKSMGVGAACDQMGWNLLSVLVSGLEINPDSGIPQPGSSVSSSSLSAILGNTKSCFASNC